MNRLKWKLKRCEDVEKNDDWNIKYLKENIHENDIIITQGAGTVTEIGPMLLK